MGLKVAQNFMSCETTVLAVKCSGGGGDCAVSERCLLLNAFSLSNIMRAYV
jgi:hypothetical protein